MIPRFRFSRQSPKSDSASKSDGLTILELLVALGVRDSGLTDSAGTIRIEIVHKGTR